MEAFLLVNAKQNNMEGGLETQVVIAVQWWNKFPYSCTTEYYTVMEISEL